MQISQVKTKPTHPIVLILVQNLICLIIFYSSNNKEVDKRVSETIKAGINNEFSYLCSGIGCFKDTFSLEVEEGSHPYKPLPRRVTYML